MALHAEAFKQIYQTLKADTGWLLDEWQEIADLMLPSKSDIQTKRTPGDDRMRRILDATAMLSNESLANHLYSLMMNFIERFFSLSITRTEDIGVIQTWLHDVATEMYQAMVASPIPTSVHEMLLQLVGPGTGCLWVDETPIEEAPVGGFRGFTARSQPIGSYYIAENGVGKVDTVYRDLELSPRQAEQRFGLDALASQMQLILGGNHQVQMYQQSLFVHGVGPDQDDGPFRSIYFDMKNNHIVQDVARPRFPYMVPRWSKANSFSPWGYGRGQMALPTARVLNSEKGDALRSYKLNNAPYNFVIGESPETVGRLSYLPGAENFLRAGTQVISARPNTDFAAMNAGITEERQLIRQIFFLHVLDFLPQVEQRTQRTLGELNLRARVMAQLMGPAFGRYLGEFLNPFIDQVFGVMMDARALPEAPQELLQLVESANVKIDVEYEGDLANAQKVSSLAAIDEALTLGGDLAERYNDPTIARVIKVHAAYRRRVVVSGFPKDLLEDERVVEQERVAQQEQRQEAAQAAEMRANAQAAGQAAPAVDAVAGAVNGTAGGG